MLHDIIYVKKIRWLEEKDCPVASLVQYLKDVSYLRDAQIEAIETYLFLKIEGENKPLWELFATGFFSQNEDLSRHNISEIAREVFYTNPAARALYEFSKWKTPNGSLQLPGLERFILENVETLDFLKLIREFFYGISYTDYLFSLPMGAGKTFLMAALIYIDLYFSINEPGNKTFAHNFMIVAPSGLKSSIIPSLKSIEKFNPAWVLPEPAASNIKKLVKFEVLDQQKAGKKSNKARNPNSQKINQYQPFEDLIGLIMVVNAEKVILDQIDIVKEGESLKFDFHESEDEKDKAANELRNLIGKIPNLQIHIDEVHHAATDDIKLRQVVSRWNVNGTINSVLGYSGTPYLSSPDKIWLSDKVNLKFTQITNTVYYYPLTLAIKKFLKKPRVEQLKGLEPIAIIENGVKDFFENYANTIYENGTVAKLAIYCGSIQRVEEEIFPYLVGKMGINPDLILKYHGGNASYKVSEQDKLEFLSLDTPLSRKKIILLVQIGKEGWDCKSLTGVILSQKGDCPTNMVLQTSCRCLRQVCKGGEETALIWLNEENAKTLDKQLKEEQDTSIQEINNLGKQEGSDLIERSSRLEHLKLPPIDFFQLRVEHSVLTTESTPNTEAKLSIILAEGRNKAVAFKETREISSNGVKDKEVIYNSGSELASFNEWLHVIVKESFQGVTAGQLKHYIPELSKIFNEITFESEGKRLFNNLYAQDAIRSQIRLAFHCKRDLKTTEEIFEKSSRLLIIEKLQAVAKHNKLFPTEQETRQILQIDATGKTVREAEESLNTAFEAQRKSLVEQGLENLFPLQAVSYSNTVHSKDKSFHFLPYDFRQSSFELNFLKEVLSLSVLKTYGLEIYYNGERHITDFSINCYEQLNSRWRYVGGYTPDFLLIQRKADKIHKAIIIETKGRGFAEQSNFEKRRKFVEQDFLRLNNEKFGYDKFEYLYLSDDQNLDSNLAVFTSKIQSFFID